MLKYSILLISTVLVTLSAFAAETKTLVWPDGTRYVGGVVDGKRSGKGTIFWQDGTRFVGIFENDQRNGPGTMILPDGTVYNGYFQNDELAENQENTGAAEPTAPVAEIDADDVIELTQAETPSTQASDGANDQIAIAQVETNAATPAEDLPVLTQEKRQLIQDAIDRWAAAWSDQNVEAYLAAYGESFKVPGRQSRRQWEGLRRSRLTRPTRIDVQVIYDTFEVISQTEVQVDFNQVYDSNLFSDRTNKRMVLTKEGEDWKIISETSI